MPSFNDLDIEDRIALTEETIRTKATLFSRWENLYSDRASGWNRRAAVAAGMLTDCPSVVDMGCGHMTLEHYLAPGTCYLPVDVVRRDDRTIVVDFNRAPPPSLAAHAAASLGLLEYLHDEGEFLGKLHSSYRILVSSYHPVRDLDLLKQRRAHAWVNDHSFDRMEELFRANGWNPAETRCLDGGQVLWKLKRICGG
jgi:hypothetical protein